MFKKISRFVLLFALCIVPARADDASRHAKAAKLITVMRLDHMMDTTFDQMKTQMPALMGSSVPMDEMNDKQKALMNEFSDKMMDTMRDEMKTKIVPQMVDVYAKTFTDEELDAMLTFYSSPIGQSVVAKTPQAMQNSMSSMQGMMTDVMPKMQALAEEYGAKMKAAGPTPAS